MEKKKYSKNVLFDTKFIVCLIIIFTLALSLIIVVTRKNDINPEIMEQSESIFDNDNKIVINQDYLPFIRLSRYDEETGNRDGIVITNTGIIYTYTFNETAVNYPDSDIFAEVQTLYFNNLKEEIGTVSPDDLTLLIKYCESIDNEYETDDMVFDTVGNSISVTNYNNEDIYVLINNEGVVNTNENTTLILNILSKYNISL